MKAYHPTTRNPRNKWAWTGLFASALMAATTMSATAAGGPGQFASTPWGKDTSAADCVVCHSLEAGGPFRLAPNLYGIVGAEKARDRAWYGYSPALIAKGGTWTEEELDLFLADANAFAPGSKKSIRVGDPEQRRKIIELLKTLGPAAQSAENK